jgi:hypothetical protein
VCCLDTHSLFSLSLSYTFTLYQAFINAELHGLTEDGLRQVPLVCTSCCTSSIQILVIVVKLVVTVDGKAADTINM